MAAYAQRWHAGVAAAEPDRQNHHGVAGRTDGLDSAPPRVWKSHRVSIGVSVQARTRTSQNKQGRNAFGTGRVVASPWVAVPQRVAVGQIVADRVDHAVALGRVDQVEAPGRVDVVNARRREGERRGDEPGGVAAADIRGRCRTEAAARTSMLNSNRGAQGRRKCDSAMPTGMLRASTSSSVR